MHTFAITLNAAFVLFLELAQGAHVYRFAFFGCFGRFGLSAKEERLRFPGIHRTGDESPMAAPWAPVKRCLLEGIRAYPPDMAQKTESLVRKYLKMPNTLVIAVVRATDTRITNDRGYALVQCNNCKELNWK
eukprot:79849-Pelagomonas_calceolata.AAC.7